MSPAALVPLLFGWGMAGLLTPVAIMVPLACLWPFLAAVNARGEYHVREHVRDMLPGAVLVLGLALVLGGRVA